MQQSRVFDESHSKSYQQLPPNVETFDNNNEKKDAPPQIPVCSNSSDPSISGKRIFSHHLYQQPAMSMDEFEETYMADYDFQYRQIDLTEYLEKEKALLKLRHFKSRLFEELLKYFRRWKQCGCYYKEDVNHFLLTMVDFIIAENRHLKSDFTVTKPIIERARELLDKHLATFVRKVATVEEALLMQPIKDAHRN
uniref:Uncharacterized protein n=1 Tax=Panagrolaimus sp. JU765 TaxID=591449 RepID=A0AC34PWM0_9BILA